MKKILSLLIAVSCFSGLAGANEMPPVLSETGAPVSAIQEEAIWNKYCVGNRNSIEIPQPKYGSPYLNGVVEKLAMISPFSYYFYSGPLYAYKLKNGKELVEPPSNFPKVKEVFNGRKNAHVFLTVLCGEFRDRPTLIENKINWVKKMYTLPATKQGPIKPKENIWSKMSAYSYNSYILNTRAIFNAKKMYNEQNNQRAIIGKYNEDFPIEPFSVCETKFIFEKYVLPGRTFGGGEDMYGKSDIKPKRSVAEQASPKLTEVELSKLASGSEEELTNLLTDCTNAGNSVQECSKKYGFAYDEDAIDEGEYPTAKPVKTKAKESAIARYRKEYATYSERKNTCSQDDKDSFYDFRGDSNFKPNSPESNGMIWYSSTIGNSCTRKADGTLVLKDKVKDKFDDPNICEKYFTSPFKYRWSAARAGLATWMLYDPKYEETFGESGSNVTVVPHLSPMTKPFGFKTGGGPEQLNPFYSSIEKNAKGEYVGWDDEKNEEIVLTGEALDKVKAEEAKELADYEAYKADYLARMAAAPKDVPLFDFSPSWASKQDVLWKTADFGFNSLVQFGPGFKNGNREMAFERIRNSVNRHTDWYASSYDDGLGVFRDQAYSPFVASSYEMSASNSFTAPGITVSSPADGCKHWMFVFKLKKSQWYNTRSIMGRTPFDFNSQWFDETSLGTNGLADSEHALDRLGTALENEMDSILYLHNLTTGGEVDPTCGQAAIEQTYGAGASVVK